MNCSVCQKNLKDYLAGSLPEDMQSQMHRHIQECADCQMAYSVQLLTEKVIATEVSEQSDPFLATRVMAKIETLGKESHVDPDFSVFKRILQPAIVVTSLAAAIVVGIFVGNLYSRAMHSNAVPEELVLLDDTSIESLNLIITENN
jgi:hypothetical protein